MLKDYTIALSAGTKTRYIAGSYDRILRQPNYKVSISPVHVQSQVKLESFLTGTPKDAAWGCDIKNNSSMTIFVIITKDGELIRSE